MQTKISLAAFGLVLLAACMFSPGNAGAADGAAEGHIVMPFFYEELARYKSVFGKTGIERAKFFTAAVFRNTETGEKVVAGKRSGSRYEVSRFKASDVPPGHYSLISFSVGDHSQDYDAEKCGKFAFTVGSGEVVVLKGPRPVAITDVGFIKHRAVVYAEFSELSPDYSAYVQREFPGKKVRLVTLKSDRPEAFRACVKSVSPVYPTLMHEDGAVAIHHK